MCGCSRVFAFCRLLINLFALTNETTPNVGDPLRIVLSGPLDKLQSKTRFGNRHGKEH